MSLEESLAKLQIGEENTPVDVAMALLDEKKALLTTKIPNVAVMNALRVYVENYRETSPKSALVMQTLYDSIIIHNKSHKGYTAELIARLFNGLQIFLGLPTQQQQGQGGGGLFGKKGR